MWAGYDNEGDIEGLDDLTHESDECREHVYQRVVAIVAEGRRSIADVRQCLLDEDANEVYQAIRLATTKGDIHIDKNMDLALGSLSWSRP